MIPSLRWEFNRTYAPEQYAKLVGLSESLCGARVEYRIAETPVFLKREMLEEMAEAGARLTGGLLANPNYLEAARKAIPHGFDMAGQTPHPNFLTADFALVRNQAGELAPRLVELQAFPSVYGYQDALTQAYREAYDLDPGLGTYLSGLDHAGYWKLLARTVLGNHDSKHVVLLELDPQNQKTYPDFAVTSQKLGIPVVDIRSLEPVGDKLFYRNAAGALVQIRRIYNRAIADELMAREVRLPFDLTQPWDVEWAGHPNWYFLISKFSIPWLTQPEAPDPVVPLAVFLDEFLSGDGRERLQRAGVPLPLEAGPQTIHTELLLKPLFSFAGKGIHFDPTRSQLEAIAPEMRKDYLLQQRMRFEHTIDTPHGMTQAEIRILYLWPDGGSLTAALSLVRLGRGKMMGVDHNKNQQWVGASAAFWSD